MTRGFNYLILIPTMCRLKFFSDIGSPETTRYSLQLYASAILMAFITKGQYHFFPRISGRKSDNAQCRSTSPIPRLYAAISAGCWIFCFPFPFIHLFALTIGCTSYALLRTVTTELSFHLTISMLPSLLKQKDALSFFFIFLTSTRGHFIILPFLIVSLCQLLSISWLRDHISMSSLKRSCRSIFCDLLDFYNFPKYFKQHVYPKFHRYLDLSFLDKFRF